MTCPNGPALDAAVVSGYAEGPAAGTTDERRANQVLGTGSLPRYPHRAVATRGAEPPRLAG